MGLVSQRVCSVTVHDLVLIGLCDIQRPNDRRLPSGPAEARGEWEGGGGGGRKITGAIREGM